MHHFGGEQKQLNWENLETTNTRVVGVHEDSMEKWKYRIPSKKTGDSFSIVYMHKLTVALTVLWNILNNDLFHKIKYFNCRIQFLSVLTFSSVRDFRLIAPGKRQKVPIEPPFGIAPVPGLFIIVNLYRRVVGRNRGGILWRGVWWSEMFCKFCLHTNVISANGYCFPTRWVFCFFAGLLSWSEDFWCFTDKLRFWRRTIINLSFIDPALHIGIQSESSDHPRPCVCQDLSLSCGEPHTTPAQAQLRRSLCFHWEFFMTIECKLSTVMGPGSVVCRSTTGVSWGYPLPQC